MSQFVASAGITVYNAAEADTQVDIPKYYEFGGGDGHGRGQWSHVRVDALIDANGTVNVSFDTTPGDWTVPIASITGAMTEVIAIPHRARKVYLSQSGPGAVLLKFGQVK